MNTSSVSGSLPPGYVIACGDLVGGGIPAGQCTLSGTALASGVGEVLIDEQSLQARIGELGAEISADYAGRDLLLVGVLKGAVFFMADLMRELTVP